jgi:hypothetical protein
MPQAARLLYCHCAYARVVPEAVKQQVLRGLTESGAAFEAVADLCELSAKRDPAMQELAGDGPLRIAACYPRAVKWLFHAAGAPLSDELVQVSNMREQTAEDVVNRLLSDNAIEESGQ